MSKEYNKYLYKHKVFVCVGYYFLENLYSPNSSGRTKFNSALQKEQLLFHDESKKIMAEYTAYDNYFYSKGKLDQKAVDDYEFAWLNHIHENPHHWQYWVLINGNDSIKALPMTKRYILELLCDWMSFDITPIEPYGTFKLNANNLKKYWECHENKMILHPKTRSSINYMIDKLVKTYGKNGTVYVKPEVLEDICKIVQRCLKLYPSNEFFIEVEK